MFAKIVTGMNLSTWLLALRFEKRRGNCSLHYFLDSFSLNVCEERGFLRKTANEGSCNPWWSWCAFVRVCCVLVTTCKTGIGIRSLFGRGHRDLHTHRKLGWERRYERGGPVSPVSSRAPSRVYPPQVLAWRGVLRNECHMRFYLRFTRIILGEFCTGIGWIVPLLNDKS